MLTPSSLDLVELGPPLAIELSDDAARALADSGLVAVDRPPGSGSYRVSSNGVVGVALVQGIELRILPKVPVDRLVFLLGYSLTGQRWLPGEVGLSARAGLLPSVAAAFARSAHRAVEQGLLQGYRDTEKSASVLRGRLRMEEQLSRRFGMPVPMEIRYDEWTTDIPENQLLLTAARRLLRVTGISAVARRSLSRLVALLADVSPLERGRPLPSWQPSRLNVRYQPAVRLAEVVLRGGSFEQQAGGLKVDGFVVNMATLFESFVTTVLREELHGRYGGRARPQDHSHLDEGGRIDMRPDLVWYDDHGVPLAVVDAKYKAEKPAGYPNADVYQLLAYCTALRLPVGHLVYARGNAAMTEHVLRGSGTVIRQHAVDLELPPDELLASTRRLTSDIARDVQATAAVSA